ncbi:MAG: hypothetical protein RMJ44_03295 [Cytophagales bacterium]|nr:hypothetical protein [Cytophagales bacterium]
MLFQVAFGLYLWAGAQISSDFFACSSTGADTAYFQQKMDALAAEVLKDLPSHEEKRIKTIHRRLFARYLRDYRQGSLLTDVLQHRQYDCLSGTIVFAYLLKKAGFQPVIYETNVHIFLTTFLSDGREVLIETTDPIGGVVTSQLQVAQRKEEYRRRFSSYQEREPGYYRSEFQIMRVVPFEELAGLQCFNQAVRAYNHGLFASAAEYLFKSQPLMATERGIELMILALKGILATHSLSFEKQNALLKAMAAYEDKLKNFPRLAIEE